MNIRFTTLCTLLLAFVAQSASAITIDVYNDGNDQLLARGRFTDRNNNFYWTEWDNLIDHVAIKSIHPDDAFYGIALLPAQNINADVKPEKNTRGIVYQLSDFHSDSGKQFTQLSTDARVTIRDAKIEVSTNLNPTNTSAPAEGDYWTGDYARY